jgi:hypothetical protein
MSHGLSNGSMTSRVIEPQVSPLKESAKKKTLERFSRGSAKSVGSESVECVVVYNDHSFKATVKRIDLACS